MLRALNGQAPFCGCALRLHRPPRRPLKGLVPRHAGAPGEQRRLRPQRTRGTPSRQRSPTIFISSERRIHSAWAIVGSDGIIVLEALFDYAAKDEVIDGMKKLGLDTRQG